LLTNVSISSGNLYRLKIEGEVTSGNIKLSGSSGLGNDQVISLPFEQDIIHDGGGNTVEIRTVGSAEGFISNVSVIEITNDTDLPRIDFTDGTGSLLLEPQRTNLYPYSNFYGTGGLVAFSGGTSSFTATNNYAISPDGTQNAIRFEASIGSTSSDRVGLRQLLTMTATDGTLSFYGKSNTSSNQTIAFHFNGATRTVVTLTNEWQRFTFTDTSSTVNNAGIEIRGTYTDTSVDVLLFGFQMEQASYATSYIPTNGSTVTRSADVANNSGNADLFNDSEGVLYAEIAALADDGTNRMIALSDNDSSDHVRIYYTTSTNKISVAVKSNGSNQYVFLNHSITDITDFIKIAVKYKANDFATFINGVQVNTQTTTANTPIGLDRLNFDGGAGAINFYGKTKCVAVFKEALSDTELQQLTS